MYRLLGRPPNVHLRVVGRSCHRRLRLGADARPHATRAGSAKDKIKKNLVAYVIAASNAC